MKRLGLYRHYKGGIYQVFAFPKCENTGNSMVLYQEKGEVRTIQIRSKVWSSCEPLWVRPCHQFFGVVDSHGRKRFTWIASQK